MITLLNRLDDSDNNRISNSDVNEIGKYFLDKKGLGPREILFTEDNSHLGFFDSSTKEIVLSSTKTDELASEFAFDLSRKYPVISDYYSYVYNYHRFWQIYYALMHIVRDNEYDIGKLDSIRKYLYELNLKYSDGGIIYFDGESSGLPLEIESSSIANDEAYRMIRSTKLPKSRLKIFDCEKLTTILSYYECGKSPIELLDEDISSIAKDIARLSYIKRFNSGLPLGYAEIMNLKDKRDRLLKKII